MGERSQQHEVTISDATGPLTLGDLRWLVQQCYQLTDAASVVVRGGRDLDARERDPAQITVRGNRPRGRGGP